MTAQATAQRSLPALARAARPHQWVKNVLVAAAPLAAGLLSFEALVQVTAAFVVFCVAASGTYLLNDALDVEADRAHPRKRHRPVASGQVPVRVALLVGYGLMALAVLLAAALSGTALVQVMGTYVVLQITYCHWLKHQAVLDIAVVASGFLLRALAGAASTDVPPSQWFLMVAAFGSLFMVAGKRYAEVLHETDGSGATRRSLASYSASYLRFVWGLAAGVVLVTYSLWSFEVGSGRSSAWASISIAPLTLALLRYAVDVDAGVAGEPEDIVLRDRVLQVLGLLWLGCLMASVHVSS